PQALLPGASDLDGQTQAVDAGVVSFEIGPEPLAEAVGERFQAVVVESRLALFQIVDQEVANRTTGEVVSVDQLLGAALSGGAKVAQRRRRLVPEDSHLVESPVEEGAAVTCPAMDL